MLLRGKNLVGYKKYDRTVIDLFIKKSSENGIDVFRISFCITLNKEI